MLLLIASFGALSGLYVLLDAPFVAVIQIIVYAGAIMVLFLFVVMLLNAPQEDTEHDVRDAPAAAARRRCGSARVLALGARRRAGLGADAQPAAVRRASTAASVQLGRGDRPLAVHRLRVRVRGDVDADSGRDGRRRRARAARAGPERS